ncbi:hypothetical protein [Pontibacterium sp.]|uniref:hypothetical protein n=1 Tax=Pontibacterium sp. TaxID=2036026 RepID=UPI00351375B0
MALLPTILAKADVLAIEAGVLVLVPKSGDQNSADKWLKENHDRLLVEILKATSRQAFIYHYYSAGGYTARKSGGVTLQFINPVTGENAFTIFNVEVNRARNTKHGQKGSRSPTKHFRVGKRSAFALFWQRAGLPLPARLSAFHDCMGKLKTRIYTGTVERCGSNGDSQIKTKSLAVLDIPQAEIQRCVYASKSPDNTLTALPDKDSAAAQETRGTQPKSTTGNLNHGQRPEALRGKVIPLYPSPFPEDQSVDEWLDERFS